MGGRGVTESASASNGKPRWGVGIGDLDPNTRQQIQAPNQIQGAVVEKVVPGSPADNAGLQPGDVIESVNRKATPSASAVQDALASVSNGDSVMLRVWSNGGSTFRVLHPSQG
jgi:serine protease Do